MWLLIRRITSSIGFLFLIFLAGWIGLKFYFTHVNRIADQVRHDVLAQIESHRTRFLTYSEIPETYKNAVISAEDRSFYSNIGILNDGELTLLAGVPNAPNVYNPFRSLSLARERQKIVVNSLVETGMVTELRAQEILEQPIRLKRNG